MALCRRVSLTDKPRICARFNLCEWVGLATHGEIFLPAFFHKTSGIPWRQFQEGLIERVTNAFDHVCFVAVCAAKRFGDDFVDDA